MDTDKKPWEIDIPIGIQKVFMQPEIRNNNIMKKVIQIHGQNVFFEVRLNDLVERGLNGARKHRLLAFEKIGDITPIVHELIDSTDNLKAKIETFIECVTELLNPIKQLPKEIQILSDMGFN